MVQNIDRPIDVWAWEPRGSESRSQCPKDTPGLPAQYRTAIVGVLPFVNLNDGADEYFSDGLTEDLIHALSLQSFFRVLSRNATFSFKGKNLSARLIAREIDATYLIQGSVRRAGNKVRVKYAELIAPEKGEQLWNGRYDRDIDDLFEMQDEITTSLFAALAPEIYRAEASAPARSSTDLTAWDRFLKVFLITTGTPRQILRPKSHCSGKRSRLIRNSQSRTPISQTIQVQGIQYGWIRSTRALWAEAMRLAESSVRLDPRSSFTYAILSYVHAMERHYEEALEAGKRAVELNPYDMGVRGVLGICYFVIGEHRQAIELFSTAAQRGNSDPRYKWPALLAFSHYLLRQYDASLSWSREALYLNPTHLQMLAARAAALAQLDRTAEAAQAVEILLNTFPDLTVERHLKNFPWKSEADIAHYREGLLKAGVPLRKSTVDKPASKLSA